MILIADTEFGLKDVKVISKAFGEWVAVEMDIAAICVHEGIGAEVIGHNIVYMR